MNHAVRENPAYVLLFTLAMCAACALLLTFAQVGWHQRIAANESFERIAAIVSALHLGGSFESRAEVVSLYDKLVEPKETEDLVVYEARRDGDVVGYALDVEGRGKYGPIRGILSFTPDRTRILDLTIYEQQETPGLGGRIGTREWLDQFRGIPVMTDGRKGIVIDSTLEGPNVVDGITGASKTTYEIGKIINSAIASFLAGGRRLVPLDLGLSADDVTMATPGYPRHLEKPPHLREEAEKRPDFMVPPGVENLALNKPVTSSTDFPILGEMEQLTDGIKKSGEFDFVELDLGPQWVQIDLEQEATIYAVAVWHYYKNPTIYNDVIVQVSNDPSFESGVTTLFNNDIDNTSGLGQGSDPAYYARWWAELVDARGGDDMPGTRCRYVRVYTNSGAGNEETRFVEIAVYGKTDQS